MRRLLRLTGIGLLFLLIAGLFATALVPPFLDRIYYRGPVSDHFDGERFFNPEGDPPRATSGGWRVARLADFLLGRARPGWPAAVPVRQARPPVRVAGEAMRVTWVGHASVLVQTQSLNILTDPVWSDVASPFPRLGGPRRVAAPGIAFADLPRIDLVLVSHNHYDHLDLPTLRRLWRRDRPLVVTGLGNDAILREAGIAAAPRDWDGRVAVRPGVEVIVERVHHWGSRWFKDRNRALWSGFTVTLPGGNLFFAGDTGYGDGAWVAQAARHGPFRLAVLPIGAYLPRGVMQNNHVDPGESATIFRRLGTAHGLAVHWGTFQLSDEPIGAPPADLARATASAGIAADRFRAVAIGEPWDVPAR